MPSLVNGHKVILIFFFDIVMNWEDLIYWVILIFVLNFKQFQANLNLP